MSQAGNNHLTSYLTVDVTAWPLVTLTTVGSPTDEQLLAHLKEIEDKVLARGADFVQIVDQREAETLDAAQRAIIAEHQECMKDLYAEHCLGEAYVADQRMKGIMIAVFWQAKPLYPYRFFDELEEAASWARHISSPRLR